MLSPAERASIFRTEGQGIIQRYTEKLRAMIQPALQAQIEAFTGRPVVSSPMQVDVKTDCVACLFVLGEKPATPL